MGLFSTIGGFAAGYIVGARRRPSPSSPQTGALAVPPVDTRRVSEIMTASPKTLPSNAMLIDAAKMMADDDIGDVIVTDPSSNAVSGIITDRDIVIRAIAKVWTRPRARSKVPTPRPRPSSPLTTWCRRHRS